MVSKDYERRIKAREDVARVFEEVRKKIKVPIFPRSRRDVLLRQFLGRMNSIARDFEERAMNLADAGKNWTHLVEEARKAIERLKQEYISMLKSEPMGEVVNKELIEEFKKL